MIDVDRRNPWAEALAALRDAADRGIEVDRRAIALLEMSHDAMRKPGAATVDIFWIGISRDGSRSMREEATVELSTPAIAEWIKATVDKMRAAECTWHSTGWIIHPSLKESSP